LILNEIQAIQPVRIQPRAKHELDCHNPETEYGKSEKFEFSHLKITLPNGERSTLQAPLLDLK
jgi:hypothetical protein